MEEFAAGTDVFITIPHVSNGNNLDVTDLQYQVLDAYGEELIAFTTAPSFDPAASSTMITVLATYNNSAQKIDVRQLNVKLVTAQGTYKQTILYKLVGDVTKLTPMVDSFMTYPESVIIRAKLSEDLKFFDMLTDEIKAVALENAYERIIKSKFDFAPIGRCQERGTDISTYTLDQFKTLPVAFQEAVKKAQLVEANMLVENSPIREKIRTGIVSETIGESSMFFRQSAVGGSKLTNMSDEAYSHIKDWIWWSATNAQIWRLARA